MTALSNVAYTLNGRADNSEYTAFRVNAGQVIHLYAAQCFGRGCIAGQDNEMTSHLKQFIDCLQSEFVHDFKRTCTVRSACIVSQIDIIIFR